MDGELLMAATIGMDVGQKLLDAMGLGHLQVTSIDIRVHIDEIVTAKLEVLLDEKQTDGLLAWTEKQFWIDQDDVKKKPEYDAQKLLDVISRVNEVSDAMPEAS